MNEIASPAVYDFAGAEPKWQAAWDAAGCFAVPDVPSGDRPKYYVLEMFPYPSGKIHMGHVRNYTLGDVVARYKRARGYQVLHPMGWDAFGLPAENAARERGVHPGVWTRTNIANMRAELQRMGLSIEWRREFATCDAAYYGQQQRLFLAFYRAGLVERRESWVNWDPVDNTVLANEQVIDGRGWRSGALVEKKLLSQWFLRITKFAPDLLSALDGLDRWPERVRTMQAKWIGRSEGAKLRFALAAQAAGIDTVEVYTTRPDTLFGMSFLAIAPEHPLAAWAAAQDQAAAAFIASCRSMGTSEAAIETAEKRGYDTGLRVRHPFMADVTFPNIPGKGEIKLKETDCFQSTCPDSIGAKPEIRASVADPTAIGTAKRVTHFSPAILTSVKATTIAVARTGMGTVGKYQWCIALAERSAVSPHVGIQPHQ